MPRWAWLGLASLVALSACDDGSAGMAWDDGGGDGALAADGGADGGLADATLLGDGMVGAALGKFTLTYYYITAVADFSGTPDTVVYAPGCRMLALVPAAFWNSLKIEGTGRLSDGSVINVSGACSCPTTPCYALVDAQHPWGVGVQNRPLVPFRSLAVDKSVIPYGSKVYVPAFDGLTMPGTPPSGGFVHDGCFSADDTGGHIIGKHIDFFAATRAYYLNLDGRVRMSMTDVALGGTRCR